MSGTRPPLLPDVGDRGLATADPDDVADLLGRAWSAAAEVAEQLPLDLPSRLTGRTVREVLVPLGSWEEHRRFVSLVADVRADRVHEVDDADGRSALVVAAHHDADNTEVAAALRRAGDVVSGFLRSGDAVTLGREATESAVGPLPLTCVLAAATYDLAVGVLDVAPPGDVPPPLTDAAIGALVDVTAGLAARQGLEVTFLVRTPDTAWATATDAEGSWTTVRLGGSGLADTGWPTVEGTAADVLDAASGRRQPVPMLLNRRLRLRDVPGLLAVVPALDAVQSLPGGGALQAAARAVARTGQAFSRFGVLSGR
ncbi:hypothetical protein [Kineosporia sp. A_224]|uniref:hypothetical protein n=1 Tax=Kineosporia sp. A_224 TaxID=1962180 RepID=UPI000B4BA3B2|nr:hypothetical protein [Kineosporia sp. A_224]